MADTSTHEILDGPNRFSNPVFNRFQHTSSLSVQSKTTLRRRWESHSNVLDRDLVVVLLNVVNHYLCACSSLYMHVYNAVPAATLSLVYVSVSVNVRIHTCMYARMHVCTYVCTYACIHDCMHISVSIYMYVCLATHQCMRIICLCKYACTPKDLCILVHYVTHTHHIHMLTCRYTPTLAHTANLWHHVTPHDIRLDNMIDMRKAKLRTHGDRWGYGCSAGSAGGSRWIMTMRYPRGLAGVHREP